MPLSLKKTALKAACCMESYTHDKNIRNISTLSSWLRISSVLLFFRRCPDFQTHHERPCFATYELRSPFLCTRLCEAETLDQDHENVNSNARENMPALYNVVSQGMVASEEDRLTIRAAPAQLPMAFQFELSLTSDHHKP